MEGRDKPLKTNKVMIGPWIAIERVPVMMRLREKFQAAE